MSSMVVMRSMAVVRALVAATLARSRLEPVAAWRPPRPVAAHELVDEGVSLCLERLAAGGVSPVLGLGDLGVEVDAAAGGTPRARRRSSAGPSAGCSTVPAPPVTKLDRGDGHAWPAQQLPEVGSSP